MSDHFVPIELKKVKSNYRELLKNKFTVILGSPGSGKTFLAKHLKNKFNGTYFTVKDFMDEKENYLIENIDKLLILDGFDEYRIFESSKNFTISKFARKIRDLLEQKDFQVILTCRELDWYGDNDSNAIKDILNFDIKSFYIKPLTKEKLDEFIENDNNIKGYIQKKEKMYSLYKKGFIYTPQLFVISKDILEKKITNKIELYYEYIISSVKEKNLSHEEKEINLSNDEILKYLGYLAYLYMFSDIDEFSKEIISEIASEEYNIKIIQHLLKSKLFQKNKFIHRSIAEFLCGIYFAKIIDQEKIDKTLIINRFRNKNFIYTELRATYAWLCAITGDLELIKIDPYFQLIYGENSHFSIDFKKKILESIREYTLKNPYFLDTKSYSLKNELVGFYEESEEFDQFLSSEFDEAIKLKNHNIYLFEMIFTSNQAKLSKDIINFLFERIFNNELVIRVKERLIKSDIFSEEQNKKILEAIKNNTIVDDNNALKIALLEKLYMKLTIDEIVQVFKLFNESSTIYICYFLYELEWDKQKELVLKIEKEIVQNVRKEYVYNEMNEKWNCLKGFLEEFYFKLFHTKSVEEIYSFLKEVRKFYKNYEKIEVKKGYINKNVEERTKEELQELSNQLFKKFFDNLQNYEKVFSKIIEFNNWFSLAFPNNISDISLKKIEEINNKEEQKELFRVAMQYWGNRENFDETFKNLSEKLEFKKEFEDFKNSLKKMEKIWEKQDNIDKKIEQQRKEIVKKNNEFFSNLSKDEFLSHFGALHFITEFILFDKEIDDYLDIKIFERFKGYLKESIFSKDFICIKYATLEQFMKNIKSFRNVDYVFYAILFLNTDNDKIFNFNKEFLKYLYILSLKMQTIANISHATYFINQFEERKEELAQTTLIEAINYNFNLLEDLKEYILKSNLEELKSLFYDLLFNQNIVDSIIRIYNFKIINNQKILKTLENIENTELLKVFKRINTNSLLNEEELIVIYKDLFEVQNANKRFKNLPQQIKLHLSYNFIKIFYDETTMPFNNGIQSDLDLTRTFVRGELINLLTKEEVEQLLEKDLSKYWQRLLKWRLVQIEENSSYQYFRIKELKDFIDNNGLLDEKDFFEYICLKIDELIEKIEANEDNEKDLFWNENKPRNENECRDAFINIFKDSKFYFTSREKNIGNDRADFEVCSKLKNDWKIRVECKKDKHTELFTAIKDQLIEKYLKNSLAQLGIYLVFYFGDKKKDIDFIKEKIEQNIPIEWKDKVKVKIIDLTK